MYDEFIKMEPYPKDWSVRNKNEKNGIKITTKGIPEKPDGLADSWKFRMKKDEHFRKPSIKVAPMTI